MSTYIKTDFLTQRPSTRRYTKPACYNPRPYIQMGDLFLMIRVMVVTIWMVLVTVGIILMIVGIR